MEEPKKYGFSEDDFEYFPEKLKSYQEACERVLFKGFRVDYNFEKKKVLRKGESMQVYVYLDGKGFDWRFPRFSRFIGQLASLELELTDNAIKRIHIGL